MTRPLPAPPEWFDQGVPLLIVKAGRYPTHHGGLYLARSAGRVGIPVWAMVETRFTPLAVSRYVTKRLPPLGLDMSGAQVVAMLAAIAQEAGVKPVVACTDDEAAILLNENAEALGPYVRMPPLAPGTSRWLASKTGLNEACDAAGVSYPRTVSSNDPAGLAEFTSRAMFPVVAKNQDPFTRRENPGVEGAEILSDPAELVSFVKSAKGRAPVILQEFVPQTHRENCVYQGYRSGRNQAVVSFTGLKIRDYPVGRGETTMAEGARDDRLKQWGDRLLAALDYRGVCDLDVLLDKRDDTYKLIDFNPRFGANCAAFQADNGIDLVRAYHLDLTGRDVPEGQQVDHVLFQVEPNDALARRSGHPARTPIRGTVLAYRAPDDPLPAAIGLARRSARSVRNRLRPQ